MAKQKISRNTLLILFVSLVAVVLVAGCLEDDTGTNSTTNPTTNETQPTTPTIPTCIGDQQSSSCCVGEGNAVLTMNNPADCCPGLRMIKTRQESKTYFGICTAPCGDGVCNPATENKRNCPQDCNPNCGDDTCQSWENASICPIDCGGCGTVVDCSVYCNNRLCDSKYENKYTCPQDCNPNCGDDTCQSWENASICPIDCGG